MPLEHRLHERCACGSSLSSARYAQGAPRPFTLSGTTRVYERARPFTIRHIALDLELDIQKKAIAGTAYLRIARVDQRAKEISLDAVGFEITEVRAGERRADTKTTHTRNTKNAKSPGGALKPAEYTYDGE